MDSVKGVSDSSSVIDDSTSDNSIEDIRDAVKNKKLHNNSGVDRKASISESKDVISMKETVLDDLKYVSRSNFCLCLLEESPEINYVYNYPDGVSLIRIVDLTDDIYKSIIDNQRTVILTDLSEFRLYMSKYELRLFVAYAPTYTAVQSLERKYIVGKEECDTWLSLRKRDEKTPSTYTLSPLNNHSGRPMTLKELEEKRRLIAKNGVLSERKNGNSRMMRGGRTDLKPSFAAVTNNTQVADKEISEKDPSTDLVSEQLANILENK